MKKLFALLLVLVMVLSLFAACGNKSDSGDRDKSDDTEGESTADTQTASVPEEEGTVEVPETEVVTVPETTEAVEEETAVALQDLTVITDEASFSKSSVKDSYGNEYEGPYYDFCSWGRNTNDDEYITQSYMEFNVNGAYRYLTGTIFTRAKQSEDHSIELLVYADDELVFQSEPLTRKDRAIELAVDIGSCDVLRIASRTYEYSSNTNPGIILVGGMVTNRFDGELTEGVEINPDLVPLTDLHVYGDHSDVLSNIEAGAVKDSFGNVYKGIYLDLCSYGNYGGVDFDTQAYTDFVTNGEYNYFSGTFFTRSGQAENAAIEFLIYADDELIYSSGMIDRSAKAVDFCVEIKDCQLLRVMSRSVYYTSTGTNPGIILVDPVVSTEKP